VNKLYVIGVGFRPLDRKARKAIQDSPVILANDRVMEIFREYEEYEAVRGKIKIINNVYETMEYIRAWITEHRTQSTDKDNRGLGSNIVLLASGDPLFFGIGRIAVREFGKDLVEILPDLSSIQVAFSRIKEPWGEAFFISLHGGPDPAKRRKLEYELEEVPALIKRYGRLGILTDKVNNPSEIARMLHSSSLTHHLPIRMYVCERLGYPDERIIEGAPGEIVNMTFVDPNVVIVLNPEHQGQGDKRDTRFGLKEEEIQHSRGLITKDEVRAVTIHKLRLPQKGIFWDIGAGSGSVSIEVARINPELMVFAIEKNDEQVENIQTNITRFDISNIRVIKGQAPDALRELPAPDRVFIGGSGGRLEEIVEVSAKKGAEIMVINATTIETLQEALNALETKGFNTEVCQVSVSSSRKINQKRHMAAHNPVFIITGTRLSMD
jgi:precorrin-6Y C5,15-methyltransferase (decarboxylating)